MVRKYEANPKYPTNVPIHKLSSPLYATSPFIIVRATAITMKPIAIIFEIRFLLIGLYEENLLYSISNAA